MILNIKWIVIGQMGHTIVSKTVAAKLLCIGIQYDLVRACGYKEAIIGIRACWREVDDEHQVTTHIAQHLVTVVVPYLGNRCCLEILLALDDFKHLSIEIA